MRVSSTVLAVTSAISVFAYSGSRAPRVSGLPIGTQVERSRSADSTTKTVLPNGVRLIFQPDKNSETVAICILVKAGLAEEDAAGIGNVASRALLGSNLNQSAAAVNRAIYEVGGSVETSWNPDYTSVTCVTSREQFENAFYVLCQALKQAEFDQASVDKAKIEALADVSQEHSDPFRAACLRLRARIYHESPYRLPFAGSEYAIQRLKAAQVKRYFELRFTPQVTVVSITGNITLERVQKAASNYLFDYERPQARRAVLIQAPESLTESARVSQSMTTSTTLIVAGFLAPALTSPDYPAFAILTALIGGGNGSRLFRSIRDATGIGYVIGAQSPVLGRDSHLLAFVEFDPKRKDANGSNVEEAAIEKLLVETVQSIISNPPAATEVERAKRFAIGSHALARQRARDRALYLGMYELLGAGYEFDSELPKKVAAVTPQDVLRVAKKFLHYHVLSVVTPEK